MSGNAFAKIAWESEHTRRSAGSGSKNADISAKGQTDRQTTQTRGFPSASTGAFTGNTRLHCSKAAAYIH